MCGQAGEGGRFGGGSRFRYYCGRETCFGQATSLAVGFAAHAARGVAAFHPVMREGCAYTFMLDSRRKPTRVMPNRSANSTAADDGAPTAATSGMPAATAFCT